MRPVILMCLVAASVRPQGGPDPVLRSETRVVQIEVTVTNSLGRPVENLSKDDFTIQDDGRRRPFQLFEAMGGAEAQETTPAQHPVTRGQQAVFSNQNAGLAARARSTILLIDAVNGWFENYVYSVRAIENLVNKIPAGERMAVFAITDTQGLVVVQDYTIDHALLRDSVSNFRPPVLQPGPAGSDDGKGETPSIHARLSPSGYEMNRAVDAVRLSLKALAERLAGTPGRKNVFWLSQGFPPSALREDRERWDGVASELNEANVALNAIDSNGLSGPPRRWGGGATDTMKELAEGMGGQAFYNRNDLDAGMARIMATSRAGYSLGFYLEDSERDNKFHRLKVTVDRRGVELHYRQGYFAGANAKREAAGKKADMESVLLSPADSDAVGIRTTADLVAGQPRDTIQLRLNLITQTLSLSPDARPGGGWKGAVDETFLELSAQGTQLARFREKKQFQFPEAVRQKVEAQGIGWPQSFPLVKGAARLLVIVRDSASGRIGSLTVPIAGL